MATLALHSAATGLKALSTEIDVIANNIANVNTVGFKQLRTNFEDLLYQHKRQPGVENELGDPAPAGLQVGLGVRISNTQMNFEQGAANETGRALDVMIEGDGLFQVQLPDELGGGVGYTRAGNFFTNVNGDLVLGNSNGYVLLDGINIPPEARTVGISAGGIVEITNPDESVTQAGQITLANFVNPAGLRAVGGNIYVATEASGPPIVGEPATGVFGSLTQGFLEQSNVDPVRELVSLIKSQRAFEMNSQTIQAADEVMQVVSNLRR